VHVFGPNFFGGGGGRVPPEFLDLHYKTRPDSNHVAKFQGDRSSNGGSRTCQMGDHGERSASLNEGLGSKPPAGSRGRASGGGQWVKPPEAESFLYIFIQKWPKKVKDLNENLPPCLSRAAMISPKLWKMGGSGRPVRP